MPWIKVLHLAALICWCAALLYVLGAAMQPRTDASQGAGPARGDAPARWLYTRIATPAALLAIVSGTALFAMGQGLALWLAAKLAVVSVLVGCHVVGGWLIQRSEDPGEDKGEGGAGRVAGPATALAAMAAMGATLWLVLDKPW